ncbi:MAG TPA: 3-deoxy-manno-octulosonate cytidylyltransferase [bacterium]|nr:3-deoxy-manno-octulosonate cytidylyltransferase [bacterium]
MPTHVVGVIPARYGATRFPGKILAPLCGEPMLHWVVTGCKQAAKVDQWLVATDDPRIVECAVGLGVEARMTDPGLPSGTDRIWAAGQDTAATHFLNIQGDEPLIDGPTIDALVETLLNSGLDTGTLARPVADGEDPADPNRVKVVIGAHGQALYFSRALVPYPRDRAEAAAAPPQIHLGCYAYTRAALQRWVSLPPHPLELTEKLEQLRALAHGLTMAVGQVNAKLLAIDAPEDVSLVEQELLRRYGAPPLAAP